jgi:hypothetical protein
MLLRLTRPTSHDIHLSLFVGQGKGRVDVSSHADHKHEDVGERERDLNEDQRNEGPDLSHVGSEQIHDGLLEVVEDLPALLHAIDDGAEVIVQQDHISSVLRDVRSGNTHGNADISLLDGWTVVDSVASDTNNSPEALIGLDNKQFLSWSGSGKYNLLFAAPAI